MRLDWRPAGQVRHGFTHFELALEVYVARVVVIDGDGFLCPVSELAGVALPSVMRKCIDVVGAAELT